MAKQEEKKVSAKIQPKTKKKTTDKWKKKTWFTVIAPKEFENKEIGETIAEKPENLTGRIVSITGRDLANQPKKQHVQIKFKITGVSGTKATTEAIGHIIKDNYLKRVVRRRSSKIMTVKNYATKEGGSYKIKVVIITENKASNRQRASIMKKTEGIVAEIIKELDSKKVVDELVFGTIPNKVYPVLKKIFPVKRIEITSSALIAAK